MSEQPSTALDRISVAPIRMPLVRVALPLDEWIRLLGYLEGVGVGDEVEHHHWIQNQIRGSFLNGKEDD